MLSEFYGLLELFVIKIFIVQNYKVAGFLDGRGSNPN
jgi:hypothetical protein